MLKYKVGKYDYTITEVLVHKESKHFVTISRGKGFVREAKESNYDKYLDTFNDACDFLLDSLNLKINNKNDEIKKLKEHQKRIILLQYK